MEKLIVIGLDGYEHSVGKEMMASGELPSLRKLSSESARFQLDHGAAKRTGLAWEHFSAGMSPTAAQRWSAVYFDPKTYRVRQKGTMCTPFPAKMDAKTVVFDAPYFDLWKAPKVRGITAWGAHDAGTNRASSPAGVLDEATRKFGPYPATDWIYGFAWPSPRRCADMGDALVRAVEQRSRMTEWLLADRLPDWDLAIVVVSELHSVTEGLWHGIDASHPLHRHASAPAAAEGMRGVYKAVDRMIGDLAAAFDGAGLVVFNMHGMGPNQSDIPGMVLLPELLYRRAFGTPFFQGPELWAAAPDGVPEPAESDEWLIETPDTSDVIDRVISFADRQVPRPIRNLIQVNAWKSWRQKRSPLPWMPASRYRPFWRRMPAFALPSYYDGSIRINLAGRERSGIVPMHAYDAECQKVVDALESCRDPFTGAAVVDEITSYGHDDPLALHQTQGDLIVVWKGAPLAFGHPEYGRIGPVPYRRTGGHTGSQGMAYIKSNGLAPGDYGMRSSFDVVPTLFDLLHQPIPAEITGDSLFAQTPRAA